MALQQIQPLTLNTTVLQSLPETKRPVFLYEWLRRLDLILSSLADGESNPGLTPSPSGSSSSETIAAAEFARREQKTRVRECQKELVKQLVDLIQHGQGQVQTSSQNQQGSQQQNQPSYPGSPIRHLIARCLTNLFTVGDTFLLFDTINK